MDILTDLTSTEILYGLMVLSYIFMFVLVVCGLKDKLKEQTYLTGKDFVFGLSLFVCSPAVAIGAFLLSAIAVFIHGSELISKLLSRPIFYKKTVD